jgi:hypothetical protein
MGMLIPDKYDAQVITQLTNAFASGSGGIDVLRAHNQKESLFDTNHTLARIAYRINALPTNDASNPNVQGKWYGLLSHIDTLSPTRENLKGILSSALANATGTISSVQFGAIYDPSQSDYTVTVSQPSANVYKLTLHCPKDPYQGPVEPLGYVPPQDKDPYGNSVEVAPTIIWPPTRRPRKSRRAAPKRARRKSARTKAGGMTRKKRRGAGSGRGKVGKR